MFKIYPQFICHGDSLALIWEDVATVIYEADAQVSRSMNSAFNNFVHTWVGRCLCKLQKAESDFLQLLVLTSPQ